MGQSTSSQSDTSSQWYPDFVKNELPVDLKGKTIAVTGCTTGMGHCFARTVIEKRAENVLLLNRDSDRSRKAEETLRQSIVEGSGTKIETIPCDLKDFESIKAAAIKIKSKYEAIDVLVNNAGIMAFDDLATTDGFDVQMQTNHLSHFLLSSQLMPLLNRAAELRGQARIVNHGSKMRAVPDSPLDARYFEKNGGNLGGDSSLAKYKRYQQSKRANLVFTVALSKKLTAADSKVISTVAAPGFAWSNLQTTSHSAQGIVGWGIHMSKVMAQSVEDGTMPLLAAAFSPKATTGTFWAPSQRMELVGPPQNTPIEDRSKNDEACELLWKTSEAATGVKFDI